MDEERERYVEEFATFWGSFGLTKMHGRVLGALLVADPPEVTAEDLADVLQVSRGSISAATRALIQLGVVERMTKLGDRKDYFRTRTNWLELMRQQTSVYGEFRKIAGRGIEIMAGRDPESRRDLEEIHSLYSFLEREMPALIERWVEQRREETK